jgi:hypothetical protein
MILNNTQANIFKVNGGLADIFANRPAATGSFYLFYSLDSQEIFYDNGSWILIAGVSLPPPPSVNIYNSDGTLTGNRQLNSNNLYFLYFNDVTNFRVTSNQGANANATFSVNGSAVLFQSSDVPSNIFRIIQTDSSEISIRNFTNISGQPGLYLKMTENRFNISTNFNNYNNNLSSGISLNFSNRTYQFGQITANNRTQITINDIAQTSIFYHASVEQGIKLDFANNTYKFGQLSGGNITLFEINDLISQINASYNGNINGLSLQFSNRTYNIGDYNNVNTDSFITCSQKIIDLVGGTSTRSRIYIDGANGIIKTIYQNSDNGLKIDFGFNRRYRFGQFTGFNTTFFQIDDNLEWVYLVNKNAVNGLFFSYNTHNYDIGRINGGNRTYLSINDSNSLFRTLYQSNEIGIKLNFAARFYQFGQITGSNTNILQIDDINNKVEFIYQGNQLGLYLDQSGKIYRFGQVTGGNGTLIEIQDGATYPVRIDGTNVTSGTAGGSSGQHLKIKINGTDYKIALLNP